MRTIGFILQKEFLQIFRNRQMAPIIFFVPIIQMLILANAATFEMKNIKMAIVDHDISSTSRRLMSKFDGSRFFKVTKFSLSDKEAALYMKQGRVNVILTIPSGLERDIYLKNNPEVQISIDAVNQNSAGLAYGYILSIISEFNQDLRVRFGNIKPQRVKIIKTIASYWYNPKLEYQAFMVPGILVIIVTLIGLFLSSMNIVREKEIGTIEQINVTPLKKHHFIVGKLVPFWIIALFDLAFGLTMGKIFFDIPIVGSIGLIFCVSSVYLLVVLGLGLFISTITHTQQQAIFVSFFFTIIFVLMSGLFTPVESMPVWAQYINRLNPVAYFIKIMRMVLLKGSGFLDIKWEFISLFIFGIFSIIMAVWRYRKRA